MEENGVTVYNLIRDEEYEDGSRTKIKCLDTEGGHLKGKQPRHFWSKRAQSVSLYFQKFTNSSRLMSLLLLVTVIQICLLSYISFGDFSFKRSLTLVPLAKGSFGQTRMAVVIPFTANDAGKVLHNLQKLWAHFLPCSPRHQIHPHVDLILYTDRVFSQMQENKLLKEIKHAAEQWTRPTHDKSANDWAKRMVAVWGQRWSISGGRISTLTDADTRGAGQCFEQVRIMSAMLSEAETKYPMGPSRMFFRAVESLGGGSVRANITAASKPKPLNAQTLAGATSQKSKGKSKRVSTTFDNDQDVAQRHSLLRRYDVMFFMEPDCLPCQQYWLTQIYEEATAQSTSRFWVRGSAMRDGDSDKSDWSFRDHINGNALYNLKDGNFILGFLEKVKAELFANEDSYLGSYDVAMDLVRKNLTLTSWEDYTSMLSLWQYTETIQNWYRTPVNATNLCKLHPNTFLVHGRDVSF